MFGANEINMITDDYGGAGTSTFPRVKEPCADDNMECMRHIEEYLVDYIYDMLIRDIEEEEE